MRLFQIKNVLGRAIYSGEYDNIKECVECAVKNRADLTGADLTDTNLRYADLTNANLRYANLTDTDLRYANLTGADLTGNSLASTKLTGASLTGARMPIFCKWDYSITDNKTINIGCESKTIEEWEQFFNSDEVLTTPRDTEEFKRIKAVFEACKAYINVMNH